MPINMRGIPPEIAALFGAGGGLPQPSGGAMPAALPNVPSVGATPGIPLPAAPEPQAPLPMLPPMPTQNRPQQGGGGKDMLLQLLPVLVSAIANRKNPLATSALMEGMARGQEAARAQQYDAEQRDEEKRFTLAKWRQQVASDAMQYDDPIDFERFKTHAGKIYAALGGDPSDIAAIPFPTSKAAKAKQAKATATLQRLKVRYGDQLEQMQDATINDPDLGRVKVSDIFALAGMSLTDATGQPVDGQATTGQQGSIEAQIIAANRRGDQAEVERLLALNERMKGSGRAPKSLQRVEVINRGRKVWANYDPTTGSFTDTKGNALPDAQPLPEKPTGGAASGLPAMSDQAINMAAQYLLRTGRMPQGISARDVEAQRAIRNRAAQIDPAINLSDVELNRRADERFVTAVNSPAANQLLMAIGNAEAHLKQMEKAFKEWNPQGLRTWNKARFNLALEGALGQKEQIAASQVDQIYTDLVAALARIYTGGQAVTNDMLELAKRNIDRDWSAGSIEQAIKTQRETITNRRNEFNALNPRGTEQSLTRTPGTGTTVGRFQIQVIK